MNCLRCNKVHDGLFGSGKFCSRQCANSRSWSEKDKLKKSQSAINSPLVLKANRIKRKGHRIEKICPICSSTFSIPLSSSKRIFCSKECYQSDTEFKFRKKTSGGYRPGSGRSKGGWYKNIWCDSSWELAWVIYHVENKMSFERNYDGFEYSYKGKTHKYYPDFILNNVFIEIKGFLTDKDLHKIKQFPFQLQVLQKKELKNILAYVIKKYGRDFIRLYENNPHKVKNNKCKICGEPAKNTFCSRKCAGIAVNKYYC